MLNASIAAGVADLVDSEQLVTARQALDNPEEVGCIRGELVRSDLAIGLADQGAVDISRHPLQQPGRLLRRHQRLR